MPMGIEQLTRTVDQLLDVDAAGLTDGELHDLVIGLMRQRNRLAALTAQAVSEWDRRMVWVSDGSRSAAARLANETPSSTKTARVEVRRARQLRSMPHTAAALVDGVISTDHVDLLGRANQSWRDAVFADHEETLVDQCRELRFHDARKVVDYWCQRADAVGSADRADRHREAAHLNASTTFDGVFVISGTLDPISGAIVDDELVKLERELHLADERNGVVRTAGQRRAAALVEMATRSATAPADGRRPKPLFTALVGDGSVADLCELANGTVIPAAALAEWISVAQLETVLFDGPSTVVSVSHRRSFTGALRRAIEVRDRTCRHRSGCDEPSHRCDVDHIVPYARNGETSQFNGRLECSPHNRNSERHDHGAVPLPSRPIDRLDEIRCRIRWRVLREVDADAEAVPDPP